MEVALSQYLYRYIEELTQHERNSIENWRDVKQWIEEAGYRRTRMAINWTQMPNVSELYGRSQDLAQLKTWVSQDDTCRLVAVNGPAGIGKTSLVITLSKTLQSEFDVVIWQSLRHKPTFKSVITYWLDQLPHITQPAQADDPYRALDCFMRFLYEHRCLVIIDIL